MNRIQTSLRPPGSLAASATGVFGVPLVAGSVRELGFSERGVLSMAILRNFSVGQNFIAVPKGLVLDGTVSLAACGLMVHILYLTSSGEPFTSEYLASQTNTPVLEILEYLTELEQGGYIEPMPDETAL